MGYYTTFELNMDNGDDQLAEIHAVLLDIDEATFHLDLEVSPSTAYNSEESGSWRHHEIDMRELSAQFPTVLFQLSGSGEENGDLWEEYYKDGKMQRIDAEITFAEFDSAKLW